MWSQIVPQSQIEASHKSCRHTEPASSVPTSLRLWSAFMVDWVQGKAGHRVQFVIAFMNNDIMDYIDWKVTLRSYTWSTCTHTSPSRKIDEKYPSLPTSSGINVGSPPSSRLFSPPSCSLPIWRKFYLRMIPPVFCQTRINILVTQMYNLNKKLPNRIAMKELNLYVDVI